MWSRRFWEATTERAVRTFAQTLAAVSISMGATTVVDVPWPNALGAAGLAALLSVLTSVAASGTGGDDGPSFGAIERVDDSDGA